MRKFLCVFFQWSESATTLRQDWTNTCVLEPCKNDASEREERKSPNPGKGSAKRSVRVYAANCDCVTCLSKSQSSCGTCRSLVEDSKLRRLAEYSFRERLKTPSSVSFFFSVKVRQIARCKSAMRCTFAAHDVNRAMPGLQMGPKQAICAVRCASQKPPLRCDAFSLRFALALRKSTAM